MGYITIISVGLVFYYIGFYFGKSYENDQNKLIKKIDECVKKIEEDKYSQMYS
jgi:hypothetical protein